MTDSTYESKNSINFYYHNMSGMRSALSEFKNDASSSNYDILLITETWLQCQHFNEEILPPFFNIFRRDRKKLTENDVLGGGVFIGVKDSYKSELLNFELADDVTFDITACKVFLPDRILFVILFYIPPNSNLHNYSELSNSIKNIINQSCENDHVWIFGDSNMPEIIYTPSELNDAFFDPSNVLKDEHQTFLTEILSQGFNQINNFTNSSGNVLDTVFTNSISDFTIELAAEKLTNKTSIHHNILNVTYYFDTNKFNSNQHKISVYDFDKADFHSINVEINNLTFPIDLSDPNDLTNYFQNSLNEIIDRHVPKRMIKNLSCPPHFNSYLRKLRNERNRFYKKYKQTNSAEHYNRWSQLSVNFKSENDRLHYEYKMSLVSKIRDDPKKFWNFINNKRKSNGYPTLMKYNEEKSDNDKEIANYFKKFFESVYQDPISFNTEDFEHIPSSQLSISDIKISQKDIIKAIKSLDMNKGAGPDLKPPKFLRNTMNSISIKLHQIFDFSLKSGIFPDTWKKSFITPIFKSGCKSDVKNYRGIAILNSIPKLFEQIVTEKLTAKILCSITSKQHGFMKRKSTVTNLSVFTSYLRTEMGKKRQIDAIYTDFQKAFDRVDHKLLIFKLNKMGIQGSILKWISSYLNDRTQTVKFNNVYSDLIKVTSGVPQGSHLGPLLFNIFINDLSYLLTDCEFLFYADDLKMFKSIADSNDTFCIQTSINILNSWCLANGMKLNVKKCNLITFARHNNVVINSYKIGNDTLERIKVVRDLGVLMDQKLTFNHHIDKIHNSGMTMLGFIKRRACEFNDPYVTKSLYCSVVRPLLEHACVIWSPYYNVYSKKVESVQKQFLLFSLRNLGWSSYHLPSYEHRLLLLNMISLRSRRNLFDIMFIYDLLRNNIDCIALSNNVIRNNNGRNLRRNRYLIEKLHNNNYTYNDTLSRCIRTFNQFSHLYDEGLSRDSFKKLVLKNLSNVNVM